MREACALVALGFLLVGLPTVAGAAPIVVTYQILPTGTAQWTPSFGTPSTGVGGGQVRVLFNTGTLASQGSLGSAGQIQDILIQFSNVGTVAGYTIPSMVVGVGPAFLGTFVYSSATSPPVVAGPAGVTVAGQFGGGSGALYVNAGQIILYAAGTQYFVATTGPLQGGSWTAPWSIFQVVGEEISRTPVPEPSTVAYLLFGAGALGALRRARARQRR